ncbi:hypothetical protein GDO86_010915, partial [Hymenochirus boettgeri]
ENIHSLRSEKYNLCLDHNTMKMEHLQSKPDMPEKLYGQGKHQLKEKQEETNFHQIIEHRQHVDYLDFLKISRGNQEKSHIEILKLEQAITEHRKEMKQVERLYQNTLEKNGQLEAKIETQILTAQSEQDVFYKEISFKEAVIHNLKMQKIDCERKLNEADKQILHQNITYKELQCQYNGLLVYVKKREELIYSLTVQLEHAIASKQEAEKEMNNYGETIKHLHSELASLQTAEESARKRIIVKECGWQELYEECEKLKYIVGEMQFKLSSSDVKINELNSEAGILKCELDNKTKEIKILEAQLKEEKESLCRASDKLKNMKKAAANKVQDKEIKREALQSQLLKAQNQYSACYDELLHREKLLQILKEENIQLTKKIKQKSQDISKNVEEKKKLELNLAVATQRHKTALQEVTNRDQVILQLKIDLKTSLEKHFSSQEQLNLQEEEVSRLQQKMKCLQIETMKLWEKCNEQEDQLNQAEKDKQQLLHKHEILSDQV